MVHNVPRAFADPKRRGPVLGAVRAVDDELGEHQRPDGRLVLDGAGDANDDHPLDIDLVEQSDGRGTRQGGADPGDHRDHRSVADPADVAQLGFPKPEAGVAAARSSIGMAHMKAITTPPWARTKKERRGIHSVPLSIYSAPGGLRQDPGHAAKSLAEARTR